MVPPRVETESASIVINGAFNPAIFSSAWFLSEQLIGRKEYDAMQVQLISRDLTSIELGWLRVQATSDSFQASTADAEEYERLRDVAIGVLRTLPHTPVGALGVNHDAHYLVDSEESWHRLGDLLSPKKLWQEALSLPGMADITVWGVRPDKYGGRIQVSVQPSQRLAHGIFISCNDHFELEEALTQPMTRQEMVRAAPGVEATPGKNRIARVILAEEWDLCRERWKTIVSTILSQLEESS